MDNKIIEFMAKNDARIDNWGKWLVVNEADTCYEITVYQHKPYQRQSVILYQGYDIELALEELE